MKTECWKPEKGDIYYVIGCVEKDIGEYNWEEDSIDKENWKNGNCFRTEAEAQAAFKKVKEVLLNLHDKQTVTNCNQLPKLTAEVFDREDCPEWAKYAAVDSNGDTYYFEQEPYIDAGQWKSENIKWQYIYCTFDPTDWQNSLIERPAELPEWCKVGEWLWLDPQKIYGPAGYKKIKNIDGLELTFADGCCIYFSHKIKQARLRSYNAEEMKALVGKVIERHSSAYLVISYAHDDLATTVYIEGKYLFADNLLRDFTIDGKPAGVFEHLENGEWVE